MAASSVARTTARHVRLAPSPTAGARVSATVAMKIIRPSKIPTGKPTPKYSGPFQITNAIAPTAPPPA